MAEERQYEEITSLGDGGTHLRIQGVRDERDVPALQELRSGICRNWFDKHDLQFVLTCSI